MKTQEVIDLIKEQMEIIEAQELLTTAVAKKRAKTAANTVKKLGVELKKSFAVV